MLVCLKVEIDSKYKQFCKTIPVIALHRAKIYTKVSSKGKSAAGALQYYYCVSRCTTSVICLVPYFTTLLVPYLQINVFARPPEQVPRGGFLTPLNKEFLWLVTKISSF